MPAIFDRMEIGDFILEHGNDDTAALILGRSRWPGIDMDRAVTAIECRRKLKNKLPEWYAEPGIIYPDKLCAEQCSSSFTAGYKASVVSEATGGSGRVADLTGGLGVDSLAFSKVAGSVLYNEMDPSRADAAVRNFSLLGAANISVLSEEVRPSAGGGSDFWDRVAYFRPDIIYMDPARRSGTGNKVFLLEECSPDILTLLPDIFSHAGKFLVKLSPMADISMLGNRFRKNGVSIEALHIVEYEGECKELLFLLTPGINETGTDTFPVYIASEKGTLRVQSGIESGNRAVLFSDEGQLSGRTLMFEPGKALSKSGLFNTVCALAGNGEHPCFKAGASTHLYFPESVEAASSLEGLGKLFRIRKMLPLCRQSIKSLSKEYPRCEVTARNIPMSSEELRKKLHSASGGDVHIFGMRIDFATGVRVSSGNYLAVTEQA